MQFTMLVRDLMTAAARRAADLHNFPRSFLILFLKDFSYV